MTSFSRIASLNPQPNDDNNRISVVWTGPDGIQREYAINQRTLNRFSTEAEIKAALDDWTMKSFGYVINDIWFHKNDNGTWVVATGEEPLIWPEDEAGP